MARIYLSPSTQVSNVGAYRSGNESTHMRQIAARVSPLLKAHGHSVRIGYTNSALGNVQDGNAWGYDFYIAIHSNAGGGEGTTVFTVPTTTSRALGNALIKHVAPVSPGERKFKMYDGSGFLEVNSTRGKSALVEVEFHDSREGADHIAANHDAYARAIANAILDVAGRKQSVAQKIVSAITRKPAPKTTAQLAAEVIAGKHGVGAARKRSLGSRYAEVQAEVNRMLLGSNAATRVVKKPAPAPKPKPAPAPKRKTNTQIAMEVIAGKWSTGNERKARLAAAGYDYAAVQKIVNQRLRKR